MNFPPQESHHDVGPQSEPQIVNKLLSISALYR